MSLFAALVLAVPFAAPVAPSGRDHFLAEVYRGGEWLPPRTGTPEVWRTWLLAEPRVADQNPQPPAPDLVPAGRWGVCRWHGEGHAPGLPTWIEVRF